MQAAAGVGRPVKYGLDLLAPSSRALCTLKRASRMALQAQKISAAAHPAAPMRDKLQLYMMMPGATPKLTRSASESSCAPKRVSAPSMRAARPSSMSKIIAKTTQVTAVFQSDSSAKRIAVAPLHDPIKVSVEGTGLLMERSSSRSSLAATIWRARARRAPRSRFCGLCICSPLSLTSVLEPRQYRFAGAHFLAGLGRYRATRRQVDIHPAAEPDNAKSRSPLHPLTLDQVAYNAPGHQARDLHHCQIAGS